MEYNQEFKKLKQISWLKSNSKLWEGRAMVGGQLSMVSHNILLTANVIKKHLDIPLTQEEKRIERAFKRGEYDKTKK